MPKLSKPTKRQQRDILDRKQAAHTRTFSKCEKCGTKQGLTNSHIIGRSYIKTQFDPRNLQCLCMSCHGYFTSNPIAFAKFVEQSSCGQYQEAMQLQALNAMVKPNYDTWDEIRHVIDYNKLTLEDARKWLAQKIIWSPPDIPKLLK